MESGERTSHAFPLASLTCVLKPYCALGVLPVTLAHQRLEVRAAKYCRTLLVLLVLIVLGLGASIAISLLVYGEDGFWRKVYASGIKGDYSDFDRMVILLQNAAILLCFLAVLFVNLLSFGGCNDIIEGVEWQNVELPSAKGLLFHHLLVIVAYMTGTGLEVAAIAARADGATIFHGDGILLLAFALLASLFVHAIVLAPELVIVRLLQVLTQALDVTSQWDLHVNEAAAQDKVATAAEGATDEEEPSSENLPLKNMEKTLLAFRRLTKTFGGNVFLLVATCLFQLIFGAYFAISTHYNADASFLELCIHLLIVAVASKRLHHVTSAVYEWQKSVDKATEKLLDSGRDQSKLGRMLERAAGGLQVHGFFAVDRRLMPVVFGHLLTYVIILVEFKQNDGP